MTRNIPLKETHIGLTWLTSFTLVLTYATLRPSRWAVHEIDMLRAWDDGLDNMDNIASSLSYSPLVNIGDRHKDGASIITVVHGKLDTGDSTAELRYIIHALDHVNDLKVESGKAYDRGLKPVLERVDRMSTTYLTKIFELCASYIHILKPNVTLFTAYHPGFRIKLKLMCKGEMKGFLAQMQGLSGSLSLLPEIVHFDSLSSEQVKLRSSFSL